ncbi:unnamed protein product, partial [Scytosiphon promiscuus]
NEADAASAEGGGTRECHKGRGAHSKRFEKNWRFFVPKRFFRPTALPCRESFRVHVRFFGKGQDLFDFPPRAALATLTLAGASRSATSDPPARLFSCLKFAGGFRLVLEGWMMRGTIRRRKVPAVF